MAETEKREVWGSRMGLILAAAGNAIGIGNFLRFPSKAAVSGGGAFMIPYVCALVFLGIPMMWVAWGIGRRGGQYGHGSTPGMFDRIWKHPISKYLGVLGIAIPLAFAMYYTYIESWMLGYAWQSLTGDFKGVVDFEAYVNEYQGNTPTGNYFNGMTFALVFALIAFAVNIFVLYRGVVKGIELLAKIAMPILFVFALVLMVRTLTLSKGLGTVGEGLAYVWKPDMTRIGDIGIWVAAAGQIFYTLSIGMGSLECYASYLKENDDIVLTGLTTSATNEFVEVIMGGSISIPATCVFLGADQVQTIAAGGTFNLGMVAMPQVLMGLGPLWLFGFMWFFLLFLAAFTSSVAVAQPVVAFFQDELKLKRPSAVTILAVIWLLGTFPCVFLGKYGFWEEIDFWAGTMGLVLFAAIEVVLFAWVFPKKPDWEKADLATVRNYVGTMGMTDAVNEMHRGADIQIPRPFLFIIKYVTPVYLGALLILWPARDLPTILDPAPRLLEGIFNRQEFSGKILKATDGGDAETLKALVREERRDYDARARIAIDAAGTVTNVEIVSASDPAFGERLAQFLRQRSYKPYTDKDSTTERPITFEISYQALYAKPYIWYARAVMVGLFGLFCILTYVAWAKRKAAAA